MRRDLRTLLQVSWVAMGVADCRVEPTQAVVLVDSDIGVPDPLSAIRVRVTSQEGDSRLDQTWSLGPGSDAVVLPASFGLAPAGGSARRTVTVDAIGLREDGRLLVETKAITSFVERRIIRLDMFLAASCVGVQCAAGQTCRRGSCVDPDMPPSACEEDPCRLVGPQCGCPAGDACVLDSRGARQCQPEGPGLPDEACSSEDGGCGAGSTCLATPSGPGICRPYCRTDADCGDPRSLCTRLSAPESPGDVGVCSSACDPLGGEPRCPAPLGCRLSFGTDIAGAIVPITSCTATGNGAVGTGCEQDWDCVDGTSCIHLEGFPSTCTAVCLAGNPVCPLGSWCAQTEPGFAVGGTEYGLCLAD